MDMKEKHFFQNPPNYNKNPFSKKGCISVSKLEHLSPIRTRAT
jgi:hypothetical protein